MSDANPPPGAISWTDLTVADAPRVRDFYQAVVGWSVSSVEMDGYDDYCMNHPSGGQTVAGICHARGDNANLPPQWLIYITVSDLDASLRQCTALQGKILAAPRQMAQGRMAVIQDPAGAVAALYQPS